MKRAIVSVLAVVLIVGLPGLSRAGLAMAVTPGRGAGPRMVAGPTSPNPSAVAGRALTGRAGFARDAAGSTGAVDPAAADTLAPTAVLDAPVTIDLGQDLAVSGARSSDVGGTIAAYVWGLDSQPPVQTTTPAFAFAFDPVAPLTVGPHTVQLTVRDDSGNVSAPASVQVVVLDAGGVPTAVVDAPAAIDFGQDLAVSGVRSADPGGSIVSYVWTLDSQPAAQTTTPSFTFPFSPAVLAVGTHVVRLEVRDDVGNQSLPAEAFVVVRDTNVAPTAVLDAPAAIDFGQDLAVSGAGSIAAPGRTITGYVWTLDSQPAAQTTTPAFTFPFSAAVLAVGTHVVRLEVTDDVGNRSALAEALVVVRDMNVAPTAVLDAPAAIDFGQDLALSGARSIAAPGRTIIGYVWTLDSQPAAQTTTPAFTFPFSPAVLTVGVHAVQFEVTDDVGNQSAPVVAQVEVLDPGAAPTAVLDAPATIELGQALTVSGARSLALAGRSIIRYIWTLDSQPSVVTSSASFTFPADPAAPLAIGRHTVRLVVTDENANESAPALAQVLVRDTIAPTTVAVVVPAPSAAGWNNTAASVELSGSDSPGGAGVIRMTYSATGACPLPVTAVPGDAVSVGVAGQGLTTVSYFATDGAGNDEASKSVDVRIDTAAPSTTASVDASGTSATVTLTAVDDLSGVVATTYSVNGSPATPYTGPFVVSGPGSFDVAFQSADAAGNLEQAGVVSFTLEASRTLCSVLGGTRLPDLDLFSFAAAAGERVRVTLSPSPAGGFSDGKALLTLFGQRLLKINASTLPSSVEATTPATATYFVSVSESIVKRPRFSGAYCVTLVSDGDAWRTLAGR